MHLKNVARSLSFLKRNLTQGDTFVARMTEAVKIFEGNVNTWCKYTKYFHAPDLIWSNLFKAVVRNFMTSGLLLALGIKLKQEI